MKLYYGPMTRANRPRWLLEELGVRYELARLDPKKGETKTPEYLRIKPVGKVPALVDGEVTMFESAAICAWLADKFPEKNLAPGVDTAQRALYYQWLFFGMTTLEAPVALHARHTTGLPPDERVAQVAEAAKAEVERALAAPEAVLENRDYLLGRFSAADVIVGGTLMWAAAQKLVARRPALEAYVARLKERAAFLRARK